MRKIGRLALCLALAFSAKAESQASRTNDLQAQRMRVDSLTAFWQRAKARLGAFDDSINATRAKLDTISAGHLRVLVVPAMRQRVQPFVEAAATHLDSIFGSAAELLARHLMVVRQYREKNDTISISVVMKPGKAFPKGREIELMWGPVAHFLIQDGLRAGAIRLLSSALDSNYSTWLGGDLNPDTVSTFHWTQARLDLVSSPASVAQRCYKGDIVACHITLGLEPVTDRATQWFDAAGRRRFFDQVFPNRFTSPLENACRAGDDAACLSAMRQINWSKLYWSPASGVLRHAVTQTALRIGGHDALARLLRSSASPANALADAAGVPLDSVVKMWQRSAVEARLPSQDVSLSIGATSLLWIAVCGVLSLRSSRWR